jgi:beta-1,4-mannosyltransferase
LRKFKKDIPSSKEPLVKVLQAVGKPDDRSNPYLWQVVSSLPAGFDIEYFSWRNVLLGKYDVIHIHWPDAMMRGASKRTTFQKQLLTATLLCRLALRKTAIVQTLHNARPHELSDSHFERFLIRRLNRMTSISIAINDQTPRLSPSIPQVTILHGHYIEWFEKHERQRVTSGRIIFFGLIRRYKGVDRLIDEFRLLDNPSARLVVRGAAIDPNLREELTTAASADQRVTLDFGHVGDSDLVTEITKSELVVLPYKQLHNSGAVILALSLNRPVLVPDVPETRAIQREVGSRWVWLYKEELSALDIGQVLSQLSDSPQHLAPNLTLRDWGPAGQQLAECYIAATLRPRNF